MFASTLRSFRMLAAMTLLTGAVYPALVTGAGRALFPWRASGSLIVDHGKVVGSELIGQSFSDPKHLWGRPSATSPHANNASASAGSNLGPTNPALTRAVEERVAALRAADPTNPLPIPVDLVTASGSGLDPHVSPAAAEYQIGRIARARGIEADAVRRITRAHTEGRSLGVLGEPRVNVVRVNRALDALDQAPRR